MSRASSRMSIPAAHPPGKMQQLAPQHVVAAAVALDETDRYKRGEDAKTRGRVQPGFGCEYLQTQRRLAGGDRVDQRRGTVQNLD